MSVELDLTGWTPKGIVFIYTGERGEDKLQMYPATCWFSPDGRLGPWDDPRLEWILFDQRQKMNMIDGADLEGIIHAWPEGWEEGDDEDS